MPRGRSNTQEYPTYEQMVEAVERYGYEIDEYAPCSIQGVLISYSRPVFEDETFIGLPVAGERVEREIIERHYCPEVDANDDVMAVTAGRARQRVIWELAADASL